MTGTAKDRLAEWTEHVDTAPHEGCRCETCQFHVFRSNMNAAGIENSKALSRLMKAARDTAWLIFNDRSSCDDDEPIILAAEELTGALVAVRAGKPERRGDG